MDVANMGSLLFVYGYNCYSYYLSVFMGCSAVPLVTHQCPI